MKYATSKILKNPYIAIDAAALFKRNKTGVEWYAWQLLKYLAREWKETDIPIALFAPSNLISLFGADCNALLHIKNKNWHLKPLKGRYLWTQYHLLKFLKRYPPALLFSPSYVAPRFLPQNIPAINVVHGLEGEYFPEFKSIKQILLEHVLTIPALKKSSAIIAVSEHTKKDLNRFYRIPLEKINTVLSGPGTLDDQHIGAGLKPAPTENKIKFLFLGGSSERKNLGLAVRIFSKIKHHYVGAGFKPAPTEMHIAGTIKDKKIKRILDRKKNIIQLGYITEKEKIEQLKSANFLLYPSYYEGFGFPVLEAQACGAVPIVLKNSGLAEVGGKGIIEFDPEKEKESIERIINYIDNPKKYKEIQQAGLQNVQKYSWQQCAKEVKNILIRIIK